MRVLNSVLFTKKELREFCIYRFIFGISYSIMIPIIPLFLQSLGIGTVVIGTIMSLYGVSKTLVQIPFGVVSDNVGDKLTLIIALLLMTFVPFAYTISSLGSFVGYIYVIQGAVLGMAAPATFSILSRSVDEKKRGESTGLASAVFTLGGGIGSSIASFIIAQYGNYKLAFYISSIGIILTLVYVIFRIRKSNITKCKVKHKKRVKNILGEIKKYNLTYKILVLSSIAFLGDYIYGCVVALFHFYAKDVLSTSVSYSLAIISIYLIVFGIGAPIAGMICDKIGNNKQLFYSFIIMNVSLLFLSFIKNIGLFTIIIVIYFIGATFLNAALQSSLSEFGNNPKIKGIVFGVVGASESCGYAFGPFVSAYIYEINKSWLFIGLFVVSIIVFFIYLLLHKKASI